MKKKKIVKMLEWKRWLIMATAQKRCPAGHLQRIAAHRITSLRIDQRPVFQDMHKDVAATVAGQLGKLAETWVQASCFIWQQTLLRLALFA